LAQAQPDTDWHVDRLYDFARELGASLLVARYSRYLIDLNRPPDDAALYQGAPRTGLCPALSFSGLPLYYEGSAYTVPTAEVQQRRLAYWQPYQDALHTLIAATIARHGHALLLDAHSIRSVVPRLFAGQLPDINVGTNDARSCNPAIIDALRELLVAQQQYSWVIDGRFKGGYITRHYGQPSHQVQALQIELAQCTYMLEPEDVATPTPAPACDQQRMAPLRVLLRAALGALLATTPA
ncbi:MAG: N-formylglutamate amidohydrolase, partial [Steroidobacteraceae bacterium]